MKPCLLRSVLPSRSHKRFVSRWWFREQIQSCTPHRSGLPPTQPPRLPPACLLLRGRGLGGSQVKLHACPGAGRFLRTGCRFSKRSITVRGLRERAAVLVMIGIGLRVILEEAMSAKPNMWRRDFYFERKSNYLTIFNQIWVYYLPSKFMWWWWCFIKKKKRKEN